MIEEAVQVTVTRAVIDDLQDARELQDWCASKPGLYCRITSRVDGDYAVEVGGLTADEKPVQFGDTVTWDGRQFAITP